MTNAHRAPHPHGDPSSTTHPLLHPHPARIAFFDVDHTLTTVTTPALFWEYWSTAARTAPLAAGRALPTAAGAAREERNRDYYRLFAGVSATELRRAGARWYAGFRATAQPFLPAPLAALRAHRAAGDPVVLVSGAPRACLLPLARDLGAGLVLGCEQLTDGRGRLTGEITRPMIGAAKADAAAEVMARHGADPANCHAYGDHSSDLPLLRLCGHPTVVGDDPALAGHAARDGWQWLPGVERLVRIHK
ncbi:HAD family phosphatase [Streptomyces sp. IMTB 2501]|uniref:HAD family hydrolase n=1 Tax=Streptomyces sp. IMTB 2501 TaxID=1776340 RepID=UPI0009A16AB9|nr:HAD-IB family hydrolase [Streptomyces sp. IMTB 2501]